MREDISISIGENGGSIKNFAAGDQVDCHTRICSAECPRVDFGATSIESDRRSEIASRAIDGEVA